MALNKEHEKEVLTRAVTFIRRQARKRKSTTINAEEQLALQQEIERMLKQYSEIRHIDLDRNEIQNLAQNLTAEAEKQYRDEISKTKRRPNPPIPSKKSSSLFTSTLTPAKDLTVAREKEEKEEMEETILFSLKFTPTALLSSDPSSSSSFPASSDPSFSAEEERKEHEYSDATEDEKEEKKNDDKNKHEDEPIVEFSNPPSGSSYSSTKQLSLLENFRSYIKGKEQYQKDTLREINFTSRGPSNKSPKTAEKFTINGYKFSAKEEKDGSLSYCTKLEKISDEEKKDTVFKVCALAVDASFQNTTFDLTNTPDDIKEMVYEGLTRRLRERDVKNPEEFITGYDAPSASSSDDADDFSPPTP